MAEPDNITLVQLRGPRGELEKLAREQAAISQRFDAVRRAVNGESFMGRIAAAEVEEQSISIGSRLEALEAKRGPKR